MFPVFPFIGQQINDDSIWKFLTRREQEISPSISGGMNCDIHGVYLIFVFHSIII